MKLDFEDCDKLQEKDISLCECALKEQGTEWRKKKKNVKNQSIHQCTSTSPPDHHTVLFYVSYILSIFFFPLCFSLFFN